MSLPADQTKPHAQGQHLGPIQLDIGVEVSTREGYPRLPSIDPQPIILRQDAPANHTGTSDGNVGNDATPPANLDRIHGQAGANGSRTALPSALQRLDTAAIIEPLAPYTEYGPTGSVYESLATPFVPISQSVGEASPLAFAHKRQNSGGGEHQLGSKKPRSEDQHNSTPPGEDAASSSGGNYAPNLNEKGTLTENYACFFYKICPERCAGYTLSKWSTVLQHLLRVHVLGYPKGSLKGFYCSICRCPFGDDKASQDAHIRAESCQKANAIQTGLLLQEEYNSIKGIDKTPDESKGIAGSPDEIRWKKAWNIMWPQLQIPQNPRFEKLVNIQRREALHPVLKYLEEAGVRVHNPKALAAGLIEIVLRIPTPTPLAVGGEAAPAEAVQVLPATTSAPATSLPLQPNAPGQSAQGASGIPISPPGEQMVFGQLPQALSAFPAAHGQQHHAMPAQEEPSFYDFDHQPNAPVSYGMAPQLPPGLANSLPNLGPANTFLGEHIVPQGFGTLQYREDLNAFAFQDQDGRVWQFPAFSTPLPSASGDWGRGVLS